MGNLSYFFQKVKKAWLSTRDQACTRLAEINGQNIQNFNVVIYFGNVASNVFLKKNYADSLKNEKNLLTSKVCTYVVVRSLNLRYITSTCTC